ncbi:MAG: carbon starvation protein A [Bacteroidales bacterium]
MITFILSLLILVAGYFLYGKYVEKVFTPNNERQTPALSRPDGVDYVPLSSRKIFLIQFLNIAGLGPIFGAIMGAMHGPVVFLWIVFGTLLCGAVHDFLSAMMSLRNEGKSLPELIANELGTSAGVVMRLLTTVLMVLVGAVFLSGPAGLLTSMTGGLLSNGGWIILIFAYYVLATLFPVDKIIGRIYPVFGFALLFMALGIMGAIFWFKAPVPELFDHFRNMNPDTEKFPVFPMLFITVACGAISGFHATQSPLMARCIKTERDGRKVFFGAMVAEGIVATIWAAAAMCFFGGMDDFQGFMAANNNSAAEVVKHISSEWLGTLGGFLALLGVVAAPITSADTAFRSARLIIADFLNVEQQSFKNRILISAPLFICCIILLNINFDIIWRYFAWCNQTLAVFTLWSITIYLARQNKNYLISLFPALFMTAVCVTYILIAPEGFSLPASVCYPVGISSALLVSGLFLVWRRKNRQVIEELN